MAKKFRFDEESHSYFFEEQEVPGVSKILKAVGLTKDSSFYTKGGSDRGKRVHSAIYVDHIEGEPEIDEEIEPYLVAWHNFKKSVQFEPFLEFCERPLFSKELWFAGTPDIVCMLNGKITLIDIKTGQVYEWVRFQTAAYAHLLKANGFKIEQRKVLKLNPNGFKLLSCDDVTDGDVWLSAVNVFHSQIVCEQSLK